MRSAVTAGTILAGFRRASDLRGRAARRRFVDAALAASRRRPGPRPRGIPPAALALPPRRRPGRMPGDRLLHRSCGKARGEQRTGRRALPLRPRTPPPPDPALFQYRDPHCLVPPWVLPLPGRTAPLRSFTADSAVPARKHDVSVREDVPPTVGERDRRD